MPDDFEEPETEVWPECWPAFNLFSQYANQWRMGFNGPIALDYVVIHHAMDRMQLTSEQYDETLDMLRIIESHALEQLCQKQT